MTEYELLKINAERRRQGLPPLSMPQAQSALRSNPSRTDDGFDTTGFLIGYMTGIPMPSAGGIMGALMHPHDSSPSFSHSSSDDNSPAGGGSYGGAGASSSWDSGSSSSSSSSYDSGSSSSSSSSDSGSSSSGGGSD